MTLHVTTRVTHEATGHTYTWEMRVNEDDFERVVGLADVPWRPADVSAEHPHSIAYTGVPLKSNAYMPMEGETS